jgi:hypothetical protein
MGKRTICLLGRPEDVLMSIVGLRDLTAMATVNSTG